MNAELALAQGIGLNAARIVLTFVVWKHDLEAFKEGLAAFLQVCVTGTASR